MATVVLLGTLDTKEVEYAFVRDRLVEAGCDVIIINAGVLGDPAYPIQFGRRDVAEAAGEDLGLLVDEADRGSAVKAMAEGAAAIVRQLHAEGQVQGLLGLGGSGGSSIISEAMRRLPVGVPKLLVSTMGAGNVAPYVGTTDIAVMYSVVDIAGINRITARVFTNAAYAIAGMARATNAPGEGSTRPLVGATMYGATTPCVDRAFALLNDAGFEVLVFHATGAGGRSMEALIRGGQITGSLDVTTAEVMADICGGTFSAGPDRLEAAGEVGIPQVVSIGGSDMIAFTPPEALPAKYRDRTLYEHNPSVTLVRSNPEECYEYGKVVAEKLARAKGPVTLFIPLRGTSSYAVAGGVFHDPAADEALIGSLRANVGPSVEMIAMDTDINAPVFAEAMVEKLREHYRAWLGAAV